MPTIPTSRDQQPFTTLPDIFRTADGTNLGIGPQDRMRNGAGGGGKAPVYGRGGAGAEVTPGRYPRIVLRDALGYELDTFTTLQEAIYRAKWKVRQSGHADTPIEWRLPKAPAPARPDLTRAAPPPKHPPVETEVDKMKKRGPYSNVLEFAVEDVGFVKESLQHLPYVPSLSFLRHDILSGPKIYFQIVGTMLMHERILSLTEKRNAVYNFPGFCSGCMRLGLCYGCAKSSEPHTHMDKPVKTGGGFTYFKKDRPEKEIAAKNPVNWRIKHPDQALKTLMEEYGGVDLEGEIPEEIRRHLDQHGGHRETVRETRARHPAPGQRPAHMPPLATEMQPTHKKRRTLPIVSEPGSGEDRMSLPDIIAPDDDQAQGDLAQHDTGSRSKVRLRGHQHKDVDIDLYDEMMDRGGGGDDEEEGELTDLDDQGHAGHYGNYQRSNAVSSRSRSEEVHSRKDVIDIDVGKRGSSYDRGVKRYSKQKKPASDTEAVGEEDGGDSDDEKDSDRASRPRKKQLYKPPPAFKLKKSPSRKIEARSPFSTDRKLNVPIGRDFELKKSNKAPTKFKAFRNVDASWKEPKKFELKENQAKPTKFWSAPRKNKDDDESRKRSKKGSPSRGRGRSRSPPRSISPDSGLDSGLMTVLVSKKPSTRSKRHPTRRVTPSASTRRVTPSASTRGVTPAGSWSRAGEDSPSVESVSWPPLDSYSDTAARYYRNRDVSGYTHSDLDSDQGESPKYRRGHRLHGLPPLRHTSQEGHHSSRRATTRSQACSQPRSQPLARFQPRSSAISPILYQGDNPRRNTSDESDSEDNWIQTAREIERHYMDHAESDTDESEGQPDQRYSDQRYTDQRYMDQRYTDQRYTDQRYTDSRRPLPPLRHGQQPLQQHEVKRSTKDLGDRDAARLPAEASRGRSRLLDREPQRDSYSPSRDRTLDGNFRHERGGTLIDRDSSSRDRAQHGMFPPLRKRAHVHADGFTSSRNTTDLDTFPKTRARKRQTPRQQQGDVRKMSRYATVGAFSSDETESEQDAGLHNETGHNHLYDQPGGYRQTRGSKQLFEESHNDPGQQQQGDSETDYSGDSVGTQRQMRADPRQLKMKQPERRPTSGCTDASGEEWPGRHDQSREHNDRCSPLEREQTYDTNISVQVTKHIKKAHHDNPVRNDGRRHKQNHTRYKKADNRDAHDTEHVKYLNAESRYQKNKGSEPEHAMYKQSGPYNENYKYTEEKTPKTKLSGDRKLRPNGTVKGYDSNTGAAVDRFAHLKKFIDIVKHNDRYSDDDGHDTPYLENPMYLQEESDGHTYDQSRNSENEHNHGTSKLRRDLRYRQRSERRGHTKKEQHGLDSDEFEHGQDGRQPTGEEYAVYRAIRKKKQNHRPRPRHHRQGLKTRGDIDTLSDKLEDFSEERSKAGIQYQGEEDEIGHDTAKGKYGRKHRRIYSRHKGPAQDNSEGLQYMHNYNSNDEDEFDEFGELYNDYDERADIEGNLEHATHPDNKMSRQGRKLKLRHLTSNTDGTFEYNAEYSTLSEGQSKRHRRKHKAMPLNSNEGDTFKYDQSYSKEGDVMYHVDKNENQKPHEYDDIYNKEGDVIYDIDEDEKRRRHRHRRRRKHRRRRDGSGEAVQEMTEEYLHQLSELSEANNSTRNDHGISTGPGYKQRGTSHDNQTRRKTERAMLDREGSESELTKKNRKEKLRRRKETRVGEYGNEQSLETRDNDHLTSSGRQKMRRMRKQHESRENTNLTLVPNEELSGNEEGLLVEHNRSEPGDYNQGDRMCNPSRKTTRRSNILQDRDRDLTMTTSKTNSFYPDSNDSLSCSDKDEGNTFEEFERTTITPNGSRIKHTRSDLNEQQQQQGQAKDTDYSGQSVMQETQPFPAPPAIPGNIDFEKGSLTSHEPDLELVFDDLIDVANLEVVDNDEDDEEVRRAEERRRRRHRHRRRKRREAEQARAAPHTHEQADQHDSSFRPRSGCETEKSSLLYTRGGGDAVAEAVGDAVEVVAQENTPLPYDGSQRGLQEESQASDTDTDDEHHIPETYHRQARTTHRNKAIRKLQATKDQKSQSKDRSLESRKSRQSKDRSVESRKTKQSKDRHFNDRKSQDRGSKERTSVDKKSKAKQTRNMKKGNLETVSKTTKDAGNIQKEKQEMRKKKPITRVADEEEFCTLPSIKTQIAKIMKGLDSKRNSRVSSIDYKQDLDNQNPSTDMMEYFRNMPSEMKWELIRPKSEEFGYVETGDGVGVACSSGMKKGRSLSMPLLTELQAMLQAGDTAGQLADLRKAFISPIYMPGFKPSRPKKQFKINPQRVKGRERSKSVDMVTDMFPWVEDEDSTVKSELGTLKEEPPIIPTPSPEPPVLPPTPEPPVMDDVRTPTPLSLQVQAQSDAAPAPPPQPAVPPSPPPDKSPPKRREIIKKEKKQRPPPPPKPPTPVREPTPTPTPPPPEETPVTSREVSFVLEKEPYKPELPPIEIPDLPEFQEKQASQAAKPKREMKLIEVAPELPEAKKKLPPPPKLAPRLRPRGPPRRSRVAEAPVTPGELQQLSDPLDFLAKYCIINPDRLPFYERVFNGSVSEQTPRYSRTEGPRPGAMVSLPPAVLSEHELNMLRDLTVLSHAQSPRREGVSAPEQYLEKLNYTVDFIKGKVDAIQQHMAKLQGEKLSYMAGLAKEMDRDIARIDYKVTGKKKKKESKTKSQKKKKKVDVVDYDKLGAMSGPVKDFKPTRLADITDEVIVSRMSDKMMKKVKKEPVVKTLSLEISRDIEKLKHYDQRIAQIEDEKDLVGLYCMDYYFSEQADPSRPHQFRRQQSRLYQKLHPNPDVEMNMDEVEAALQQINNKLLTDKEVQYIYFVLELPKREKISFRLFSIIAALSEKVTQMDPVIRKLINKQDYKALDVKMERSKELFDLLQDADLMPAGNAPADNLAVELTAGGLTPEHTNYVLSKFDRKGQGFCDFLDFVTYVPLFIQIHKRIVDDPFNDSLDV